eukprot:9485291-Alexandrium_andersonii.AAC.1
MCIRDRACRCGALVRHAGGACWRGVPVRHAGAACWGVLAESGRTDRDRAGRNKAGQCEEWEH